MGPLQPFLQRLFPFITLGIVLLVVAFGIIIFAYLFVFGTLFGIILYLGNTIKNKISTKQAQSRTKRQTAGRIIDSNDWKVH